MYNEEYVLVVLLTWFAGCSDNCSLLKSIRQVFYKFYGKRDHLNVKISKKQKFTNMGSITHISLGFGLE